jgi:hypothetical protein
LYDNLGRDIGDIVYALLPDFDHEHGRQLPGATLGGQSIKPLLLFHGPGIKAKATIERTVWLVDVVPTLSWAMGWPTPTEAEGAVLYQIFDQHSTNFPRAEQMKAQQERLNRTRKSLAQTQRQPTTPVKQKDIAKAAPEAVSDQQPMPETVEELQEALRAARAEAKKWKSAYDRYHRITHGN